MTPERGEERSGLCGQGPAYSSMDRAVVKDCQPQTQPSYPISAGRPGVPETILKLCVCRGSARRALLPSLGRTMVGSYFALPSAYTQRFRRLNNP